MRFGANAWVSREGSGTTAARIEDPEAIPVRMASRRLAAGREEVAFTPDRADVPGVFGVILNLAAQACDLDVNASVEGCSLVAANQVEESVAA